MYLESQDVGQQRLVVLGARLLSVHQVGDQLQVSEVLESGERLPGHVEVQRLEGGLPERLPVALRHPETGGLVRLREGASLQELVHGRGQGNVDTGHAGKCERAF